MTSVVKLRENNMKEIEVYMNTESSRTYNKSLPVSTDTSTGREMKISPIVKRNYDTNNSFRNPHLLSPEHKHIMKELPY